MHYEKFADGSIKCIENEIPFDIPGSWCWCRLGIIFQHNTGKALNASNQYGNSYKYITTSNVYWDRFELDSIKEMHITSDELEKCTVVKGDLLVCEGGDIGRTAIWDKDYSICIQNHLHRMRPVLTTCNRFYYYIMYLYKHNGMINGNGIGLQGLSSNKLHDLIVPMPSYAEQLRIAEHIDTYIQLIGEINNQQKDIDDLIKTVKSRILDLAIRGKLVPQDPNDEPASVLLERIKAEKEELIKQGKIKRDKKESTIFKGEDNSYYEKIPNGWVLAQLETLIDYEQPTEYLVENTDYKLENMIPVLTAGKSFILGYTNEKTGIYNKVPVIIFDDFTTESKYVDFPFKVKSSAMKILKPDNRVILTKYAYFLLQTVHVDHDNHQRYWISTFCKQVVVLPPLREQERIVQCIEYCFEKLDNMT